MGKKDELSKVYSVSEFKTHALELLERVSKQRHSLRITKHNKMIARIDPIEKQTTQGRLGRLVGTIIEEHDLVSPVAVDDWDANR